MPTNFLTNLVSNFPMNETTQGAQALDVHGNLHLDVHDGIRQVAGQAAGARRLNKSLATCFSRDGAAWDITGTKNFLISFWIKPHPVQGASTIFNLFDANQDYPIYSTFASAAGTVGSFYFSLESDNYNISYFSLPTDTWHHVLFWRDLTSGEFGMRFNDSVEVVGTLPGSTALNAMAAPSVIEVGGEFGAGAANFDIEEISLWIGQTKTAQAATNLYNGGTPLPYSSYSSKGFDF